MFTSLVETNRCAVCIDGYYEWKQNVHGSQNKTGSVPYFIRMKPEAGALAQKSLILAGMYFTISNQQYSGEGDEDQYSNHLVLMTQPSSVAGQLKDIHHRMPVFLDQQSLRMWLDTENYAFERCESQIMKLKVFD